MNEGEEVADDLPLSEYGQRLDSAFNRLNGRVKYCGWSAFAHLRAAWKLRTIDLGMAAFRAITAEEEAATALIFALRIKKYPNAEWLNHRRHDHKASLYALIQTLARIFSQINYTPDVFFFDKEDPPNIRIQIDVHQLAGMADAEPFYAQPVLPLDFNIADSAGIKNFSAELHELAGENGYAKIQAYIEAEANLRNRILYASDIGIPKVDIKDAFIFVRRDRVLTLLTIALMIMQTDEHQAFAVQCLNALLAALDRLDAALPTQEKAAEPCRSRIEISRTPRTTRVQVVQNDSAETVHYEFSQSVTVNYRWLDLWVL